jgi:midasin
MADNAMYDPLTMDVGRQVEKLISTYSVAVKYAPTLQNATSYVERANALAGLLLVPALCTTVASLFRPILVDLCARLLHVEELVEEKFVALATLLQPHVELFP